MNGIVSPNPRRFLFAAFLCDTGLRMNVALDSLGSIRSWRRRRRVKCLRVVFVFEIPAAHRWAFSSLHSPAHREKTTLKAAHEAVLTQHYACEEDYDITEITVCRSETDVLMWLTAQTTTDQTEYEHFSAQLENTRTTSSVLLKGMISDEFFMFITLYVTADRGRRDTSQDGGMEGQRHLVGSLQK